MGEVLKVARQKIVDRNNNIIAYELLYRNGELDGSKTDDELTIDVITTALLKIGYSTISDGVKLAINFSNSYLLKNISEMISPGFAIIEILEDVVLDESFKSKIIACKEKGFLIALDDFSIESIIDTDILNYVDIIKVDFRNTKQIEKSVIEDFLNTHENISLLAEKIETKEEYDYAMDAGYSLFQGYYIEKPETMYYEA